MASKLVFSLTAFVFIIFLPTACSPEGDTTEITVFAAASLQDALDDIIAAYSEKTGVNIVSNYNSSGLLAKQLLSGAPTDIFISANFKWADHVIDNNRGFNNRPFAGNSLVIATPAGGKAGTIKAIDDLAALDELTIAIGDPAHVPAGMYAQQALKGAGLWEAVSERLIFAVNVRAALTYAEQEAADCAIVYESDAVGMDHMHLIPIAEKLHQPIRYISLTSKKNPSPAVERFIAFLHSEEAGAILREYGFTPEEQ
jgi:molybdate transport system substrate-binding protein